MAIYSFSSLPDATINCIFASKPLLLTAVHNAYSAFDLTSQKAALDAMWNNTGPGGDKSIYGTIDNFLAAIGCTSSSVPIPISPSGGWLSDSTPIGGMQVPNAAIAGGGALAAYLFLFRRRR